MQVRLEFVGPGWMILSITHGQQAAQLVASYLRDTPRDLLEALVRVLHGEPEARILVEHEPDVSLLRLRLLPGELLRIEVHGPGDDGPPPEPLDEPVFRHTEPAERFAGRVLGELDGLLREGGEAGYGQRWGLHPFPRRPYDALAQVLRDRGLRPG